MTASNKTRTQSIQEQFLQNPVTVLDCIFPHKNLLAGGLFANSQQRPLILVRTMIPLSFREVGGKLKKKIYLRENITNQPFPTQYSHRSNTQELAKNEIRNSIFGGIELSGR